MPLYLTEDFSYIVDMIDLLKLYYDIGIYDAITQHVVHVSEDDFFELQLIGLEYIAPIGYRCSVEEFKLLYRNTVFADTYAYDENDIQLASSPDMIEYYRLCRLYEHREGVEPEQNPYVVAAENYYKETLRATDSYFGAGFDDDHHTTMLYIETCPDCEYSVIEIIELIHDMLMYYTRQLPKLERDIRFGKFTFLPELPAYKGGD